jgi:hypothetical protein
MAVFTQRRVWYAGICVLLCGASVLHAVDGIVVGIVEGTQYNQYYGREKGELWTYTIEDDEVAGQRKVFDGPATRPRLSPDGEHIGFLKNNLVCVMPVEGGTVTTLAAAHQHSVLDFPHKDWIYYVEEGAYHEPGSHTVKRVHVQDKTVEPVFSLDTDDRIAQLAVSNDLTRACIRPGDNDGSQFKGAVTGYDIQTGDYHEISGSYSCATGIFSGGQNIMDGWGHHNGFDIRNWETGDEVKSFSNATAIGWPPLDGQHNVADVHAIFHSGGATNDPHWMCIVTGNCEGSESTRNDKNKYQLLINWYDERCILVNAALLQQGKKFFDSGDFWKKTTTRAKPGAAHKASRDREISWDLRVITVKRKIYITMTVPAVYSAADNISIDVYDMRGAHTGTVFRGVCTPGTHRISVAAAALSAGWYCVTVQTGRHGIIRRPMHVQ